MNSKKVSKVPTIRRLPTYLHKLGEMQKQGIDVVATPELARYMRLGEIVVRKDLAITGISGQPGVGYKTGELIEGIRRFLGWDNTSEAVLVGTGSLGSAILGYEGFEEYGLRIVAAFDADLNKIGKTIHKRKVLDVGTLTDYIKEHKVKIGIICVPAPFAQEVADMMVAGGIAGVWNFANVSLQLPDNVVAEREVIAGGLAVLSIKLQKNFSED